MAERRFTRKVAPTKRVTYRVPLAVEAAIYALAEKDGVSLNATGSRLLQFALAHLACRVEPTWEEIRE